VDDGLLYVLGGLTGVDADGGAIYRLDAKDGKPVPWPSGVLDLKIAALWPADSRTKTVSGRRHGRAPWTHLPQLHQFGVSFTVLDGKTGDYLQTVVGAPPA